MYLAGLDRAAGRRWVPNAEIARRVGVARPTVVSWRRRYPESGIAGVIGSGPVGPPGQHRRGRRGGRDADQAAGIAGVTHWSARLLADQLASPLPRCPDLPGVEPAALAAIRRGTFTPVKDLIAAIEAFIDGWNERCHPFVRPKNRGRNPDKAHRKQTSNTRH
jgi:Homeodomain-like domain-containing protein